MKGDTHFGNDDNFTKIHASFHVHWNLLIRKNIAPPDDDMRYFTCGFPPAKEVGFPKSLLEDPWGMMINDEMMWNFSVNENYYEIFPLASIFKPSILTPPNTSIPPSPKKCGGNLNNQGNTKPCEKTKLQYTIFTKESSQKNTNFVHFVRFIRKNGVHP